MITALTLSRLQFGLTAMFHFIFPPFSIGIGILLVIFESLYLIRRDPVYEKLTRFWIKIFAANFSIGVATGIVLEFEFGTNWSVYSRYVGDIFGSPLAAEGIFAFFLESGFLAILLFGWGRVKPWVHWFSTLMVAIGSTMSAFWIIAANSWQQTPVAYKLVNHNGIERAVITDFWSMVFNPSTLVRFFHTVMGSWIQGSFLVMSISAYYILKRKHSTIAKKSFTIAASVALVASLAQPLIGHYHAQVVAKYQPIKLAAYEGLFRGQENAPLYLFGWVDEENQKTYGLKLPGMLSFLIHNDFDQKVKGLDEVPKSQWPNINQVFQSYHLMVSLGMFFIALTSFSLYAVYRKRIWDNRLLLKTCLYSVPLPVIANQAGWFSAERGRQPWVVQGLLKTSDAVSPSLSTEEVAISFLLFLVLYILLFFTWVYVLDKEIKHGPSNVESAPVAGYQKNRDLMVKEIKS